MSDFLARLAARALGAVETARPRLLSRFEPYPDPADVPSTAFEQAVETAPAPPRAHPEPASPKLEPVSTVRHGGEESAQERPRRENPVEELEELAPAPPRLRPEPTLPKLEPVSAVRRGGEEGVQERPRRGNPVEESEKLAPAPPRAHPEPTSPKLEPVSKRVSEKSYDGLQSPHPLAPSPVRPPALHLERERGEVAGAVAASPTSAFFAAQGCELVLGAPTVSPLSRGRSGGRWERGTGGEEHGHAGSRIFETPSKVRRSHEDLREPRVPGTLIPADVPAVEPAAASPGSDRASVSISAQRPNPVSGAPAGESVRPLEPGRREPVLAEASAKPRPPVPRSVPAERRVSWFASSPEGRDGDSPPAVHVTIGRIEVKAVQPPPPSAAPRAAEAPRLTLEEYLRRRSEGRM